MFLAIPHSAEFRWGRFPWLVITIIVLCTAIYYAEYKSNLRLDGVFLPYCQQIHDPVLNPDDPALMMRSNLDECGDALDSIHHRPEKRRYIEYLLKSAEHSYNSVSDTPITEGIREAYHHYQVASRSVPTSLDASLMSDPLFFNPLRSITAALAHASWLHLIGNMLFFFAFTPVLEMVIGNRLRLVAVMLVIALACDFFYFLSVQLFGADALPALGFSGVVMGMIGLSAYLLPKVKIRTFVWIFFYARNIYIPAGLLAAWYIGWDAWYMATGTGSSGVNFLAHVVGGVCGYLLGYLWFSALKHEIRHEVADEIEHHRARRHDKFGVLSSFRSSQPHLANARREAHAKREFSEYLGKIYRAVNVGNDALAINLLLSRYDDYRHALELYEEIYYEMLQWPESRTMLCLSRLLIDEYIAARKYAKAIEVARRALQITPEFVFAQPGQRELLQSMNNGKEIAPSGFT